MILLSHHLFHSLCRDRCGSVSLITGGAMVALLGVAALAVDIGNVVNTKRQLQGSTDAAALAGARVIGSTTDPIATAVSYSAISGQKNAQTNLSVTMASGYPMLKCLSSTGVSCVGSPASNAISVIQQANAPTYFAKVLGIDSVSLSASATASAKGGKSTPVDAVVILDTTASMNSSDSSCSINNATKLDCALAGVRALLGGFWPSVDQVGLMIYPGLKSTVSVGLEYDCQASTPSNTGNYNVAKSDTVSDIANYAASPQYVIIPLESSYQVVPAGAQTGPLSQSDPLVKAAGGKPNCTGVTAVGGVKTFFADVITAAQTVLQTNGRSGVQKAIILLSDGDANAPQSITYDEVDAGGNPVYLKDKDGHYVLDRNGKKQQAKMDVANMPTGTTLGTVSNQCHNAITAARSAAAAGTWVYSIAYGASTSATSSCSTDSPRISACDTMRQIASDSNKFFADKVGGSSCASQARSTSELVNIFQNIGTDMTSARLISDDTK
jgi:Flp pilus assembly protein TadG